MNQRERLTATLNREPVDAVPWYADLTYWHSAHERAGDLDERYCGADGLLRLHRDLGVGVYLFTPPLVRVIRDPERYRRETEQIEPGVTRTRISSPEGVLTTVSRELPGSGTSAVLEWPVKTVNDLAVVRSWYDAASYEPNYDEVLACDRTWGDAGHGIPLTPRTPLAALAAEWSGVTALSYLATDHPAELEQTIRAMESAEDELYRLTEAAPVPAVEIPDNLSAETMTGLWLRYSRDYYRKRIAGLHRSGKLVGCHIDGTLGKLLGELVRAGVDFPESVVPAPVGDLELEQIRVETSPETIIWGCVPGAMFAPPYEPDYVLDFVRRAVQVLGSTGRLVMASADQVPPDGDITLVRRIGEELERIGPPLYG